MKKLFGFLAAVAFLAATGMSAASVTARAEETTHVVEPESKVCASLTPFAWYEFDDSENLGKDTMGRFDLTVAKSIAGTIEQKEDGGDKYVELRRNNETNSQSGVLLYAPQLDKTGLDFSDVIRDSFSVSLTFRSPAATGTNGSHYVLSVGRYNDAVTIVPWRNGFHVQTWTKQFMLSDDVTQEEVDNCKGKVQILANASEWVNVTVVGNHDDEKVYIYVDGELVQSVDTENVQLSNQGQGTLGADYTFSIGGQCAVNGGGNEMHADADIKDCKVFDYALSGDNVAALAAGTDTEYTGPSVASLPELDTAGVDFQLTDRHTIADLMDEMKTNVNVTLADGTKEKASLFWTTLGSAEKIYGIVQSAAANRKGLMYEYDVAYVVKLKYDSDAVVISDFKVGAASHEPTETVTVDGNKRLSVSFKLDLKEGYSIREVLYADVNEFLEDEWREEGYVYISTRYGAVIDIRTTGGGSDDSSVSASDSETSGGSSGSASADNSASQGGSGCGSAMGGVLFCAVPALFAALSFKKKNS